MTNEEARQFLESMVRFTESKCLSDATPETVATLERLQGQGIPRDDAIRLIANMISLEVIFMQKDGESFNEERFNSNLAKLPNMPWDLEPSSG